MNTPVDQVKHGDWIFTCRMNPVRFDRWLDTDQPEGVNGENDYFTTLEGSDHSRLHCSLKVVSPEYAEWFIENRMWQWYELFSTDRFAKNAPWRRVQLGTPQYRQVLYRRTSIGGCEYTYDKENGSYRLRVFSHGTFIYYPPQDTPFDLHRSAWDVYGAYVKHRAELDGLVYEGY